MSRQESTRTQQALEAVREHPSRYAIPMGLTAARPILGGLGVKAAREGDWRKARQNFRLSSATDMEGYAARFLQATTNAGAALDPVADGIERAEVGIALAPHMSKVTVAATTLLELDSLRLNAQIQDKNNPRVPVAAKWGSALEAAGADVFMTGMVEDDKTLKVAGQAAIVGGAVIRNASYRILRKMIRSN